MLAIKKLKKTWYYSTERWKNMSEKEKRIQILCPKCKKQMEELNNFYECKNCLFLCGKEENIENYTIS